MIFPAWKRLNWTGLEVFLRELVVTTGETGCAKGLGDPARRQQSGIVYQA